MYDVLLDEYEDESTRTRVKEQPVDETVVQDVEDDDEGATEIPAVEADAELDREEVLSIIDDTDTWSDDPVRMYLTQMGEIPLLDRGKEISLAKKIEVTRRWFRRKVLECDFALREVFRPSGTRQRHRHQTQTNHEQSHTAPHTMLLKTSNVTNAALSIRSQ